MPRRPFDNRRPAAGNPVVASPDPVHTLRDLESWSFAGTALAVLGQPIGHSVSPAMHNAALADLAHTQPEFAAWRYFRFEIAPADLGAALALLHAKRFRGINLTVPHKILAFAQVASVDPAAQPVGAVNTLLWTDRGWHGANTDGYGLATALREDLGLDLAGSHVILLGAGGAARGAAVECLQRGCASLAIANRTRENLSTLLAQLAPLAGAVPLRGFDPASPPADLPAGAIVINATSAGLRPDDPVPIDLAQLPRPRGVFDMIYNPPLTPLLRAAAAQGLPGANGLAMLVHQGAKALEIWGGASAARTAPVMAEAVRALRS
jgi:shikimate dehydrogenase